MNNTYDSTNTVPTTEAGPPSDTTVGGQPPEATEADQPGTGVEQTPVDSGAPAPETRTWQPPMAYNNVPDELRAYPCCCWRYETREGTQKPSKVPYNPITGARADTSDPSTFAPFDEAVQALSTGHYNGIGVLITADLGAIDIDGCIGDDGQLSEMAADVVNTMEAYAEVSPSGRGIRILFRVPSNYIYNKARYYINNPPIHMEIYVAGATKKYVTITVICSP